MVNSGPLVRDRHRPATAEPPANERAPAAPVEPPAGLPRRGPNGFEAAATVLSLVALTVVGTASGVAFAYNHPDAMAQVAMVHAFERYGLGSFSVGETNYIAKMPLYWAVSQLGLAPHRELLVDAAVCNLAGIGLVFTAVHLGARRLLGLGVRRAWYTAWLVGLIMALNLQHIFLANYPNSRNLELGLGLVLSVAIIAFCRVNPRPAPPGPAVLAGTAALVVLLSFSDPLMLYALLVPVYAVSVGYALAGRRLRDRRALTSVALLGAALVAGFLAPRLLAAVAPDAIHWAHIGPVANRPSAGRSVGEIERSLRYGLNVDFGRLDPRYGLRANGFQTDWLNLVMLGLGALAVVRLGLRRLRFLAFGAVPVVLNLVELTLVDPDEANLSRYLIVTVTIIWVAGVVAIVATHPPRSRLVPATLATVLVVAGVSVAANLWTLRTTRWYPSDQDVAQTEAILEADGIHGVLSSWDRTIRLSFFSDGRILVGVADCTAGQVSPATRGNLMADSQLRAAAADRVDHLLVAPPGVDDTCSFVRGDGRYALVATTPMGDVYQVPDLVRG